MENLLGDPVAFPWMASHAAIRASDAERESVAERLRHAAGEGRLEPEELEERLHAALRARTQGDLRRLLADLPSRSMPGRPRRAVPVARTAFAVAVRVATVLATVVVVLMAAAVMVAWWMVAALVWLAVWGRRACVARLDARAVQRRRLA